MIYLAGHIVPISSIIDDILIRYLKNKNFQDIIAFDNDIEKYSNPRNGLLLPFTYHKCYDKNYFNFDEKGKINILKKGDHENLFSKFGIDSNAKLNINLDDEIISFINERNEIYKRNN
ncbi:MAG: HNH endonuclease [Mycoplasmataceae bacterium]|nr:HNH endonuclease [Mycoplasmataceae bacterium]